MGTIDLTTSANNRRHLRRRIAVVFVGLLIVSALVLLSRRGGATNTADGTDATEHQSDTSGHEVTPGVLDPPTFAVDPALVPEMLGLPPLQEGGPPRKLVRVADALGHEVDFVADELLLVTDDPAQLDAFLLRWDGEVLHATELPSLDGHPSTSYVVRVDPMRGDPAGLADDVLAMDPNSRGAHTLSSDAALRLVAAGAASAADGLTVGLNTLFESYEDFSTSAVAEAAGFDPGDKNENPLGGTYDPNPMNWPHMRVGDIQKIGVADAWRMLELAGKLGGDPVDIAILDGGFIVDSPDYPDEWSEFSVLPFQPATGEPNLGQSSKPWHGTNVAMVAAAKVDNGFGTAGSGGPVASLITVNTTGDAGMGIAAISTAIAAGADIINMSYGIDWPATVSFLGMPFSFATMVADSFGVMTIASAGNDGEDIDAEDCFVFCWEEAFWSPCENADVFCIGGLATNSRSAAENSNYGYEWCEDADCDVDMFGPYDVYLGDDGNHNGDAARVGHGTSYAAPFVAGVAALVWAADRDGLDDDDVQHLLRHWAHGGGQWKVDRYVNAAGSVYHALGGNIPTFAQIVEPANDTTVDYGGFNAVTFRAEGDDRYDGECCTFEWSSDVDGSLGSGATLEHVFSSPGNRVVTLTATAADGGTATRSVKVKVTNSDPVPAIHAPVAGEKVPRHVSFNLDGTSSDYNDLQPPCETLTWTSTEAADQKANGGSFPAVGCHPVVTFKGNNGLRIVTLTATDEHGGTNSTNVYFTVVDPPVHPTVTITAPFATSFDPGEAIDLLADTYEPDGDAVTYEWWLITDNGHQLIGTTEDIHDWVPSDFIGSSCGISDGRLVLEATDKDGQSSAKVDIGVNYGPC